MRPEVIDEMARVQACVGNASSVHGRGRAARREVDKARELLAGLIDAVPENIVFTGSGSEANNLALRGAPADTLLISAMEHDSVLAAAAASGKKVALVRALSDGGVDLAHLEELLGEAEGRVLVSIHTANNETGVLQPIAAIAEHCRAHKALFHTDAVQALGKVRLDFGDLGADMMSLSAHKIGGPQGVGALVVGSRIALTPIIAGGGQELGRRSGTENVAGIAGFGIAAEQAAGGFARWQGIAELRDRMEARVSQVSPSNIIYGAGRERLPNTSCFSMPGVLGETQVMAMDIEGFAISSGAACSSGKVKASHVLMAMGVDEGAARETIRISLCPGTNQDEIDGFLTAWTRLCERTRDRVVSARG